MADSAPPKPTDAAPEQAATSKSAGTKSQCLTHTIKSTTEIAEKKKAKQLEKEARLAAKLAAAGGAAGASGEKKVKPAKEKKKDVEEPFVNTTPKGEKKGAWHRIYDGP